MGGMQPQGVPSQFFPGQPNGMGMPPPMGFSNQQQMGLVFVDQQMMHGQQPPHFWQMQAGPLSPHSPGGMGPMVPMMPPGQPPMRLPPSMPDAQARQQQQQQMGSYIAAAPSPGAMG